MKWILLLTIMAAVSGEESWNEDRNCFYESTTGECARCADQCNEGTTLFMKKMMVDPKDGSPAVAKFTRCVTSWFDSEYITDHVDNKIYQQCMCWGDCIYIYIYIYIYIDCPTGMIFTRITATNGLGCVNTCPQATTTENILETATGAENDGSSLTIEVCTIADSTTFFTAWGRVYEGQAVGCHLNGTQASCQSYYNYNNNANTFDIYNKDSVTGDIYISGQQEGGRNDDTHYSYSDFHMWSVRNFVEPRNFCIYTSADKKYIVQFPAMNDDATIEYAECMSLESCPGTVNAADTEADGNSVRCLLTNIEANINFGQKGEQCRGPTWGPCRTCNDQGQKYAVHGKNAGYDNSNVPEYFYTCSHEVPKDVDGNIIQDIVCEKLHPTGFEEFDQGYNNPYHQELILFECYHIAGNIYIYIYYIHICNTIYI